MTLTGNAKQINTAKECIVINAEKTKSTAMPMDNAVKEWNASMVTVQRAL